VKKSPPQRRCILVTGLSGSGKSTALKLLEDLGFFAIDNLPVALLPSLIRSLGATQKNFPRVALGMDAREKSFLKSYALVLRTLEDATWKPEVLFLDASEKVLIRRFSESRRPHPLGKSRPLRGAIAEEKRRLQALKRISPRVIDTSHLNVHQLKKTLQKQLHPGKKVAGFGFTVVSFGYKHGIPAEADLLLDTRFLDNPYFVDRLKSLDGRHRSVKSYVLRQADAQAFLRHVMSFLKFLLPRFQNEGKNHLTLALGCTGGRHRSVALAEELGKRLKSRDRQVSVVHRDLRSGD
jgi:Predicted P-loop-containing kinase